MQLTREEKAIHDQALIDGANFTRAEWHFMRSLISVEQSKLYKKFDFKTSKAYVAHFAKIGESAAETFCAVARKALKVPELEQALLERKITAGKASRFLSILNSENASELIDFAAKHTEREIDAEVAHRNPKALPKDKVRILSDTHVLIITAMSKEDYEKLRRVGSLEAQKQNLATLGTLVGICAETHLEKHDPIRKARRAKPRKSNAKPGRRPNAEQTRAVDLRDEGRCTWVNKEGVRCNSDRWVDKHHIHEYAKGGSNEPDNITTLCAHHHDLVHQMDLPLDGHISWLRSPIVEYRCH